MPDFGNYDDTDYSSPSSGTFDSASMTPELQQRAATLTQPHNYGLATTLLGDAALAVPDLIDTVASSIPGVSSSLGIKRGDFNQSMLNMIDQPGLTNFYNENKGGIEVGSAIAGIIGSELATGGLVSALAPFVATMRGASWAKRALSLDSEYTAAISNVAKVDMALGQRAALGASQYVDAAEILPTLNTGGKLIESTVPSMFSRAGAATKARFIGTVKGGLRAGATEAVMATTLNQNSFLYSEDESTNIMFAGLGIAVGGAFGGLGANYAMRKFVNSDKMQQIYAGTLDSTGLERQMIDPANVVKGVNDSTYKETYLGSLKGSVSDRVTAYMVQAKAAPEVGVDASNASRISTQRIQLAHEEAQKLTIGGIPSVPGTGFSMNSPGFGNHLRDILKKDEGALLQTELMAGAGDGMSVSKIYADHVDHVAKRVDDIQTMMGGNGWKRLSDSAKKGYQAEMKQLAFVKKLTPVPFIDGEATTLAHAASYDNWFEPAITKKADEGLTTWESVPAQGGKPHGVGIDSDMSIYLPRKADLSTADHFDMLRLYRSAQDMITDTLSDPKGVLKLPASPSWFQLDMAEEMLKRSKGSGRVQFPGGMTRESAQVESFAQKVDALASSHLTDDATDIAKLRVRYNLPQLTAYEAGVLGTDEHPLDIIVRGAIAKGGGSAIRGLSLPEVLDGITQSRKLTNLTETSTREARSLTGNTLNFLRDSDGNPVKPLLALKRPFAPQEYVKDNLAERLAVKKMDTLEKLTGGQADEVTRTLVQNTMNSPDYLLAAKASSLADIQMSATLPGLANKPPTSGLRNATDGLSTTEWKFRDNPVMQAMTRVRETNERVAQSFMRQAMENTVGPILPKLNGPRNAESLALIDQFHSHAQGWHIMEKPLEIQLPSGKKGYQFVLEDNAANQELFKQSYGRDMNSGEILQTPQGKPIVLDEIAMEAQTAFNRLSDTRRVQENVLKNALDLPETRRAAWYVPAQSVEGKIIGHTYDSLGNIVPNKTIIANTQEQFARLKNQLEPTLEEGEAFRSQDEVKEFATAMDRAQQEMVNPGRVFNGIGESNLRKNSQQGMRTGAFQESLATIRDGMLSHGRDVHELMFKDQINAAKMRSQISMGALPGNLSDTQKQSSRSIFDYYVQEATGRSPLNSEKSWWGRTYNELEGKANKFLAESPTAQAPGRVFAQVRDYFKQANPYKLGDTEQEVFAKMSQNLGEYMPFNSVADRLASEGLGKKPPTLADITGGLNRFEATWVLRMLEPVQAAMNMGGMLNAAPAVMRHVAQKPGETVEEMAARIGHSSQIFSLDSDRAVGVLDMGKMMLRGFKRSWSRAADPEFDFMSRNGHLDFQMAEFRKSFNSIESKGTWDRWMNGDAQSTNKFAQKGVVGWASYLTDKSEDFSRSWGHMMGLELADTLGIDGQLAKHNFAHDIANKMIANYSPANRAEAFQGAVGAPIGLFQSFIIAYYQRLFRYAETGDVASLGAQYAMQAGLFGTKTIPGFSEVNKLFADHDDGKSSPYDNIVARFGQSAGDVLMGGTLGNIPKMFGASSGIDLTTRGDTTFRTPQLQGFPVATTAMKIWDGIGQGIRLMGDKNPEITGNQLAEIASNTIPNRPISGMIEQFFGGQNDTDARGQLISHSADLAESAYRVIGSRSYRQAKDLEAFYSNKGAMEIKANQDQILATNTRMLIRGNGNSIDGLPDLMESYIDNGGDPKMYKRWIKNQFKSATETRSQRQLEDAMKSPLHSDRADRLLNAQVSLNQEDQVSNDYQGSPQDSMDGALPTNSSENDVNMMYGMNQ